MLRRPIESAQHTAWTFTDRARKSGLLPLIGSVGDCYDKAMIEAFWSRMQVELLDTHRLRTQVELANAIFEYVEVFHNRRRRHSSLGMLAPIEFELNSTYTTTGSPSQGMRLHRTPCAAPCQRKRVNFNLR